MKVKYKIILSTGINFLIIVSLFLSTTAISVYAQNAADPKYFNFLKKNQLEYIPNSNSLSSFVKKYLNHSKLIMVGEMHGTEISYQFISDLVKELSADKNFRYLIIEHDYVSATEINQYLKTGDKYFLDKFFKDAKGTFTYNKSYYSFFEEVYKINQKRKTNQIEVVGVDIQQSILKGIRYIDSLSKINNFNLSDLPEAQKCFQTVSKSKNTDSLIQSIMNLVQEFKENESVYDKVFNQVSSEVKYIVRNIDNNMYCSNSDNYNEARDQKMFENFMYFENKLDITKHKSVGFFGRGHSQKAKTSTGNSLTSLIHQTYPSLDIKSINLYYLTEGCKFILPKEYFPNLTNTEYKLYGVGNFFQDEKDFSGIDKLNLASGKKSNVLYLLNKKESPYLQSKDLIYEILEDYYTLDYIDFAVLIKSSKAVTPLMEK
jgi:hypothetical protein